MKKRNIVLKKLTLVKGIVMEIGKEQALKVAGGSDAIIFAIPVR